MKFSTRSALIFVFLAAAWLPLTAQIAGDSETETPPPGGTIITSDQLHSDDNTHISIFTGNVIVVGTNFKLTCQEMSVYFTKDNKIERIVATGDVVIIQPDRVTRCGHAEYFHADDKFVLTDLPVIHDHQNVISGPIIIIYRTTQKMIIPPGSGRTQVVLPPDNGTSAPKTAAPAPEPK
jgi:lipopolysaccharide export system protein LptA